jgi:hypothetical protein
MLIPVTDLVTGALTEIRVARAGDVVRAEDLALGVLLLNEVLERLPVAPHALYARTETAYVLTPGLQPHTIGPTGTFVVPRRPVRLTHANVVLPTGSSRQPIDVLKSPAWWADVRTRTIASAIPEAGYYNPVWPNGELNLYPVPSQPYGLELQTETEIAGGVPVTEADTIDLPQGYSELLRLWTAKKAAPSFAREFSKASNDELLQALSDVFGSNIRVNDLRTLDAGVPGGRGGGYDYRTGQVG